MSCSDKFGIDTCIWCLQQAHRVEELQREWGALGPLEGPETVRLLDKRQAKAWKLPLRMSEALQQVSMRLMHPVHLGNSVAWKLACARVRACSRWANLYYLSILQQTPAVLPAECKCLPPLNAAPTKHLCTLRRFVASPLEPCQEAKPRSQWRRHLKLSCRCWPRSNTCCAMACCAPLLCQPQHTNKPCQGLLHLYLALSCSLLCRFSSSTAILCDAVEVLLSPDLRYLLCRQLRLCCELVQLGSAV